MTNKFSPDVNCMLNFCKEEANRLHNAKVTSVHLLLGILRFEKCLAYQLLNAVGADLNAIKTLMEELAIQNATLDNIPFENIEMAPESLRLLRLSVLEARVMQQTIVDTQHILLGILKKDDNEASRILNQQHIYYEDIVALANGEKNPDATTHNSTSSMYDEEDEEDATPTMNREGASSSKPSNQTTNSHTPILDKFSTDLTKAAREGLLDPVVGREGEVERVAQILCRRKKNNPILIGQPGVGKSAIVEGLATRIVEHRISHHLWDKRVLTLDLSSVVAGTKFRGQFEERIRNIVNELQKHPEIIIFIDEIHTIVGAGNASGSMDAANMLKPALARGEIQCIGATTTDEFRKTIEKDGALERRFQKVPVQPTSREETLQILRQLQTRYEKFHQVRYSDEAIEACVQLTDRYVTDRCFPDKAIDAMDEVGSRMHIQDQPINPQIAILEQRVKEMHQHKLEAVKKGQYEQAAEYLSLTTKAQEELDKFRSDWEATLSSQEYSVNEADVAHVVSMMTGIPVQRISTEENQKLRMLPQTLCSKVVGQDEAVKTLVRAIQRSRIGIKDPRKPIATFMFVGPTGVGKTYLTKILAEELFGSAENIIRLDMSEYMEKHTVSRMVGAPPGYVGYEEGGQLTEQVRRKPYSIVLLDEIEKAHTDVFNILLQVMDEGRLTDGNGATIDFKNTIIIMTSNCGTRQLKEFGQGVGFKSQNDILQNRKESRSIIQKALQKQFAPEFLNRLDNIIHFEQLTQQDIRRIVDIELEPLIRRIAEIGYQLQVTTEARDLIGRKGYDVQYGARPIKRAIQELVEDTLCDTLMLNNPQPGSCLVAQTKEDTICITTLQDEAEQPKQLSPILYNE